MILKIAIVERATQGHLFDHDSSILQPTHVPHDCQVKNPAFLGVAYLGSPSPISTEFGWSDIFCYLGLQREHNNAFAGLGAEVRMQALHLDPKDIPNDSFQERARVFQEPMAGLLDQLAIAVVLVRFDKFK